MVESPAPRRRRRRPTRRPGRLEGIAIRALLGLLARLPLPLARGLLGYVAWLAWRLGLVGRDVTLANLAHCYPNLTAEEREQLGRAAVRHTAWLLAEQGAVWHWPRDRWHALIDDDQAGPQLRAALPTTEGDSAGTLLLVPHLGNWELLSLYLGEMQVTALYAPPRLQSLEGPIRAARERTGARLLPIDRSGLKGLLAALDQGGLVALLPDQVPDPAAGVYAPFFGQPALTMTFAHRLIRRTRPKVIMAALLRTGHGFELVMQSVDQKVSDPDPLVSATAMNSAIEALVTLAPDQYQWSYKRFKRPPPGAPKIY